MVQPIAVVRYVARSATQVSRLRCILALVVTSGLGCILPVRGDVVRLQTTQSVANRANAYSKTINRFNRLSTKLAMLRGGDSGAEIRGDLHLVQNQPLGLHKIWGNGFFSTWQGPNFLKVINDRYAFELNRQTQTTWRLDSLVNDPYRSDAYEKAVALMREATLQTLHLPSSVGIADLLRHKKTAVFSADILIEEQQYVIQAATQGERYFPSCRLRLVLDRARSALLSYDAVVFPDVQRPITGRSILFIHGETAYDPASKEVLIPQSRTVRFCVCDLVYGVCREYLLKGNVESISFDQTSILRDYLLTSYRLPEPDFSVWDYSEGNVPLGNSAIVFGTTAGGVVVLASILWLGRRAAIQRARWAALATSQ